MIKGLKQGQGLKTNTNEIDVGRLMRKRSIVVLAMLSVCLLTLSYSIGFASASIGFNDEFSASSLNSGWVASDPLGTNPFSLTANPGSLTISTNSGPEFNLARTTMTSPSILQSVSGDFVITTCVSGTFGPAGYEAAGLLVWKDSSNFYRAERWFGEDDGLQQVHTAGNYHGSGSGNNGWVNGAYHAFASNQNPTYLKITRVGTTLTAYWSADGNTWNQFDQTTFDATDPVSVGLSIINVGGGLFQPNFEYFRITPNNNINPLPESPIAAIFLPIAVVGAFIIYKVKVSSKATKLVSY